MSPTHSPKQMGPAWSRKAKVELFGERGANRFDEALIAAHAFAQASNCPAGGEVFKWLASKSDELIAAELARPSNRGEG